LRTPEIARHPRDHRKPNKWRADQAQKKRCLGIGAGTVQKQVRFRREQHGQACHGCHYGEH
jgi:hypothetical protein